MQACFKHNHRKKSPKFHFKEVLHSSKVKWRDYTNLIANTCKKSLGSSYFGAWDDFHLNPFKVILLNLSQWVELIYLWINLSTVEYIKHVFLTFKQTNKQTNNNKQQKQKENKTKKKKTTLGSDISLLL